jgi:hypothetical protein
MADKQRLMTEPDDSCFDTTEFNGSLTYDGHVADVTFTAHAGEDCRLVVAPIPVEAETYMALNKAMGRPGQHGHSTSLIGESKDGAKFSSRDMDVSGMRHSNDGFFVQLKTGKASVTLARKDQSKDQAAGIKFSLRGFKSFRPKPVKCGLGYVTVLGNHKVTSEDEVTGHIIVQSDEQDPDEVWYQQAANMAEFVWKGLQFGHGGRLQMPFEQVFYRESVTATFYRGAGRQRHLPSIHHLDQSDFIAALVARFESKDPFPDAVWQVVGWLNSDSSIDEERFLTLMTAIETIVDNLVPDAETTLIPKAQYKPIREKLIDTLSQCNLGSTETQILSNKIMGLNTAPISHKMKAVIKKYDLPGDVFNADLMKRLNKQRVSIVHKGFALPDDDLWECLIYAREMVAQIILAELKYTGRYESYVPDTDALQVGTPEALN